LGWGHRDAEEPAQGHTGHSGQQGFEASIQLSSQTSSPVALGSCICFCSTECPVRNSVSGLVVGPGQSFSNLRCGGFQVAAAGEGVEREVASLRGPRGTRVVAGFDCIL